jgi:hypothetical protein
MIVSAAGKIELQNLANDGVGAIASGEISGRAGFGRAVGTFEVRDDAIAFFFEREELGLALDVEAKLGELGDEEMLVFVLGKNQRVRIRTKASSEFAEDRAGGVVAGDPEIHGDGLMTAGDDGVGEAELAIKFEGARLHGESARRGAGFRGFVDEAHAHAEAREPEGQDEAGGTGADHEDVGIAIWGFGHKARFACLQFILPGPVLQKLTNRRPRL